MCASLARELDRLCSVQSSLWELESSTTSTFGCICESTIKMAHIEKQTGRNRHRPKDHGKREPGGGSTAMARALASCRSHMRWHAGFLQPPFRGRKTPQGPGALPQRRAKPQMAFRWDQKKPQGTPTAGSKALLPPGTAIAGCVVTTNTPVQSNGLSPCPLTAPGNPSSHLSTVAGH